LYAKQKGANAMHIAIYNATKKALTVVTSSTHVENYWRQRDENEKLYTLEDFAYVDAEELADYEHDDLLESGWEVL
jgi:hypothetical protein